jgi:hypothetical protein
MPVIVHGLCRCVTRRAHYAPGDAIVDRDTRMAAPGQNPDFETAREKTSKLVPERLRFSEFRACGRGLTG